MPPAESHPLRPRTWTASNLLGPALGIASLLLYSRTLAPSLGGTIDSPEFQQATYSLSIVHPTGYPLYLLLGRLWITLFPFGDPAFRVNLLSALFGALAVWVLYASVNSVTRSRAAAVAAAALFAVQAVPWAQASVAEINSFNTLLTGLAFLAAVQWTRGRVGLPLLALAYGLAVSHHRTALLYAPLILAYMLVSTRASAHRKVTHRALVLSVVLLAAPFALYVYLPLRAFTTGWYINSPQGLLQHMLGESALPVLEGALARPFLPRLRSLVLGELFAGLPGRLLLAAGVAGAGYALVAVARRARLVRAWQTQGGGVDRPGAFLYFAAFLVGAVFATFYDIVDVSDYLGVPVFMWCVVAGVGIAAAVQATSAAANRLRVPTRLPRAAAAAAVLVPAVALVGLTAAQSLSRQDIRVDFSGLDRRPFWRDIQASSALVPSGSVLLADWPEANEALYLQRVERWRRDLQVVVVDSVLQDDAAPVATLLARKQQVFMIGAQEPVISRFAVERAGSLWRLESRIADEPVPPMEHSLNRRYGDKIELAGYTLRPKVGVLSAGELLKLTLYWRALAPIAERYVVMNHVVDESGGKIAQRDDEPGRGFSPTVAWKPGQILPDTHILAISPDTRPGTYRLVTGLYPRIGEGRLPAYDPGGTPLGDYPTLVPITIR